MRSDWMVWLGSILLFGGGAVWAQIPIKKDFFVVDNVHDLFEILGALATVVAVCVAAANINSWKHQVHAAADLDLARKVVSALHRYKSKMHGAWVWANFSIEQLETGEVPPLDFQPFFDSEINPLFKEISEAQVELKELLVQCKSAWRIDVETEENMIFEFTDRCSHIVKSSLKWIDALNSNPAQARRLDDFIRMHWAWFDKHCCQDYEGFIVFSNKSISALERKIEAKLLIQ